MRIEYLDSKEGQSLLWRAKTDNSAVEQVIKIFTPYIFYMISKITPDYELREDYTQEAQLTLLNCIRTYDPARCIKFKTFFLTCLRNNLSRTSTKNRIFGIDYITLRRRKQLQIEVISLEKDTGDTIDLEDYIVEDMFFKEEFAKTLSCLTDREKEILKYRVGLDSYPHTLEEIGTIYHLTRERIRQIEAKAKRKLRGTMRNLNIMK